MFEKSQYSGTVESSSNGKTRVITDNGINMTIPTEKEYVAGQKVTIRKGKITERIWE